ncbi:MAG: type I pullulanase [Treponema sp.]|nr:type I pullulanase [Treponema sp.]
MIEGQTPSIIFAAADSADTVTVALSEAPEDYGVFAVYEEGRKLAGKAAKGRTGREAVISLEKPIADPAKFYAVRDESGVYAGKALAMRNILDRFYYDGGDLGLGYRPGESVFKVWAPAAAAVSVALYDSAGSYDASGRLKAGEEENARLYRMERDLSTGVWRALIAGDLRGRYYLYRVEFPGGVTRWAADPYARAVSANGRRMAVISLGDTDPPGWDADKKPLFSTPQDAVIYELHVRDFSIDVNSGMKHRGKFLAFTERGTRNREGAATGVDHLASLGITHVHLLPSFDFGSVNELTVDDPASQDPKFNWGYDPVNYNVPEGSYSTDPRDPKARIGEFKRMVLALHNAGIRVVMDVVYNHTYRDEDGPFDALVKGYYYRTGDDGTLSDGSACGNEVASERPMVRKFIVDSCLYWAREYHVDGFRFDLMALIDKDTMEQIARELRSRVDPGILVYGEPWQAGGSALPEARQTTIGAQKNLGVAVFNDRIRAAIKGGSDDDSRGFATGQGGLEQALVRGIEGSVDDFAAAASESVNYVTAHDNLNLWDKIALSLGAENLAAAPYSLLGPGGNTLSGNPPGGDPPDPEALLENEAVRSALLANGIVFTSQGIPFFQAGDEMLRTKFGDHNSYASPDSVNMIRWENASRYRPVIEYYAGLIRLRKEHPAFRMDSRAGIKKAITVLCAEDRAVSFVLGGNANGDSWRSIFVAYNAGRAPRLLALPEPALRWHQVAGTRKAGTEILAEIDSGALTLPPVSLAVLYTD